MIKVKDFQAIDMTRIKLQDAQAYLNSSLTLEHGKKFLDGNTFTIFDNDEIIFIGGLIEMWDNRYLAWALLSPNANKHLYQITKITKRLFSRYPDSRIECFLDPEFKQGLRWANIFGFEYEGRMKKFYPNKADSLLYALT